MYIGIDPGKNGGIAVLGESIDPVCVYAAVKMPETERDILDFLNKEIQDARPVYAVIEKVHSSPQMGVVSAFTFGKGYGGLLMALTAHRVAFAEVAPRVWQKAIGCLSGGDKNVTKRRAQQLFPNEKVTHATADCLLIAEFCRRSHQP